MFSLSENKPNMDIILEREWLKEGALVVGTTAAGTPGVSGSDAGHLSEPVGITFGPDGVLYVSDFNNHKIRKVTPGSQTISNYAGSGSAGFAEGAVGTALFNGPTQMCFGPNGDLYVADALGHRIRKIAGGQVSTVAGTGAAGNVEGGPATETKLNTPSGLALIGGDMYIANRRSHRVQKLSGGNITAFAGDGTAGPDGDNGQAASMRVNNPIWLTAGPNGALYVVDSENHRVRKIDSAGNVTTVAGTGTAGPAAEQLNDPRAVAVDAAGTLYVADMRNNRIVKVQNGTPTVLAGGTQGSANGELYFPQGIAVGPDGYVYVADTKNHRIMKY